jgi:hypothetical protein
VVKLPKPIMFLPQIFGRAPVARFIMSIRRRLPRSTCPSRSLRPVASPAP